MASACINHIGFSPDTFFDHPWRPRQMPHQDADPHTLSVSDLPQEPDPDLSHQDIADFEFRLEDPVIMLPADQLFSDGKLIPLHLPLIRHQPTATTTTTAPSPDTPKPRRRINAVSVADPFVYSPKAPSCSSRWRELLGFRKLYQTNNAKSENIRATHNGNANGNGNGNGNGATKSIKHFLHRGSKSCNDSSVHLPLLKDTDNEATSVSSRLSLSSSSSGHDPDELPRLSLDSEKPGKASLNTNSNSNSNNPPRMRMVKTRTASIDGSATTRVGRSPMRCPAERGVSIDSPRMNSSGKIVFHSLERSSSSPSSLNGGVRLKHRGMERSYSGNVRVLNVPVCSLRGGSKSGGVFGLPLFSSAKEGSKGGGRRAGKGKIQASV